jgi:hypothetical protein
MVRIVNILLVVIFRLGLSKYVPLEFTRCGSNRCLAKEWQTVKRCLHGKFNNAGLDPRKLVRSTDYIGAFVHCHGSWAVQLASGGYLSVCLSVWFGRLEDYCRVLLHVCMIGSPYDDDRRPCCFVTVLVCPVSRLVASSLSVYTQHCWPTG